MIAIPMLTKQDLEVFKGKRVVIYSQRTNAISLYKCFKSNGIEVLCFCKEEKPSWSKRTKDKIRGLVTITPEQLPQYIENYDNIIVQSYEFDNARIKHVQDVAKQLGVKSSSLTAGEITNAFLPPSEFHAQKNLVYFLWKRFRSEQSFSRINNPNWGLLRCKKMKDLIVICSPTKTADFSLMYTFDMWNAYATRQRVGSKIEYINLWHTPRAFKHVIKQKKIEKIKVIVGLREPISQNLSEFYQRISAGSFFIPLLFNSSAFELTANSRINTLERYIKQFQTDACNAQVWWNNYVEPYTITQKKLGEEKIHTGYIQNFIPMFQKKAVDILSYPFNQEKGYTIIKESNIEVFVYQLEKLNNLVPELSAWIGTPFDKIEKGNVASDKWIADSYKQAQKEIEITQEYFDKCFNEPYVKHCYSEADIEKFKARWRPHIKNKAQ